MWNPSSLVPPGMRPWVVVISIVLFLAFGSFMQCLVKTVQPPPGCLQFAWSEARASKILGGWSEDQRPAVRRNLALDFLLIVIYVTGIAVACAMAANALDAARWSGGGAMGGILARAIIVAGLLDAIENVAQLLMLAGQKAQPWPALVTVCASMKWFLIAVTCLYAVYGGAAFVCHHFAVRK